MALGQLTSSVVTIRWMQASSPAFCDRFCAAVDLAQTIHGGQLRPGTRIPYLAHLLVVTGLVVEDGGAEPASLAVRRANVRCPRLLITQSV